MSVLDPPRPRVEASSSAPAAGRSASELPPLVREALRVVGFAALGALAAVSWASLVDPRATGRMLLALAIAVALPLGLRFVHRLPRWPRHIATTAGVVALLAATLLAAGAPPRLLVPDAWDDLGAGLWQGLTALPSLTVPYRGGDEWARLVILLDGALLLAAAGCAALAPETLGIRRGARVTGAIALVVVYAVPGVILTPSRPWVSGALCFVLLAAYLWIDRIGPRAAGPALAGILAAAVAGLAVGPLLDGPQPWFDYEEFAQSLDPTAKASTFDWSHSYGPITWPRDGKEVLRVRAREPSYWKAENLDLFDGRVWRPALTPFRAGPKDEIPLEGRARERDNERIRVTVRGLKTDQVIGAGTTYDIIGSPRDVRPAESSGTWEALEPLRTGDSYIAIVYTPRPRVEDLQSAGADYATFPAASYRELILPRADGSSPASGGVQVSFLPFKQGGTTPAAGLTSSGVVRLTAAQVEQNLAYSRTYRLAQRLLAESTTPYDYVRRVQDYLAKGFVYTETPPVRARPLEAFLFEDKRGYCQQFSGAMAMLLRMGGVPARVASGFTRGTYEKKRREYSVSDLDAHSWVEVWFPKIGWVPFDPTPTDAPARAADRDDPTVLTGPAPGGLQRSETPSGVAVPAAPAPAAAASAPFPWGPIVLGLAALAAVGGVLLGTLWVRRRSAQAADDPALHELERALRVSGRAPAPATTLLDLERRFASSEGASGYVRAVRAARFRGRAAEPTRRQRRALRAELARGLGLGGRLRALWALPPWPV